ncbi:MAG: penicillin-binding transpeptidase domain-containing protein, partial [Verrucomicrobiota bacterium]
MNKATVQRRAIVVVGGLVCLLSLLSYRLVHIQFIKHGEFAAMGRPSKTKGVPVVAPRGAIVDRHGEVLAFSKPIRRIEIDKYQYPRAVPMCAILAKAQGGGDPEAMAAHLDKSQRVDYFEQLIAERLAPATFRPKEDMEPGSQEEAEALDEWRQSLYEFISDPRKKHVPLRQLVDATAIESVEAEMSKWGGVKFITQYKRIYPAGKTACHVMGYVSGSKGKEGAEGALDYFLAGQDGLGSSDGRQLLREPVPGRHVRLTIDLALQGVVEDVLDQAYVDTGASKVVAILTDPYNGEILALANRPHFDPNDLNQGEAVDRFNVAVCGAYEPGSTFKVIAHGAAIDQGLVSLRTHYHCHWGFLEDLALTDLGKYGNISVQEILAVSSNIGTYKIAKELDPGDYFNYILNMGFQEKTGVRLTAEKPGRVPHPDRWHDNTLSRLAMGYGVQA